MSEPSLLAALQADLDALEYPPRSTARALAFALSDKRVIPLILYRLRRHVRSDFPPVLGPALGKLLGHLAWWISSCDISDDAVLDPGIVFPHPIGITIGRGVIVRAGSKIFQNVTLGARAGNGTEYPTVLPGSVIYPGAVVTGQITVGPASIVGANVVLRKSLPAGATAKSTDPTILQRP